MKIFQRAILFIAAATFFILLWKLHANEVWAHLSLIGWGILLIFAQESVAHCCNALGWRFTFPALKAKTYPFMELIKLRIAGDGVNYLTPSGTIAGEFMRAQLLNDSQSPEVRYGSVAVGKLSQSLAQALFILLGLLLAVTNETTIIQGHPELLHNARIVLTAILSFFVLYGIWVYHFTNPELPPKTGGRNPLDAPDDPISFKETLAAVPRQCRQYFRDHPSRFLLSIGFFIAGYAWGAFEVYWLCRFLGVPVLIKTSMAIEVLSQLVDMMFFMIPAKVGTQEAGKTAIFAALGLPPSAGFAFGLVRHLRELSWAGLGLLLCYKQKKYRSTPDNSARVSSRAKKPVLI